MLYPLLAYSITLTILLHVVQALHTHCIIHMSLCMYVYIYFSVQNGYKRRRRETALYWQQKDAKKACSWFFMKRRRSVSSKRNEHGKTNGPSASHASSPSSIETREQISFTRTNNFSLAFFAKHFNEVSFLQCECLVGKSRSHKLIERNGEQAL